VLERSIWRSGASKCAPLARSTTATRAHYTSFAFTRRLASEGLVGSMGTVGDALDNAMCESLIGTMKIEKLNRQPWRSVEDVRAAIFEWIETWYNRRRRHSSLGYLSPSSTRASTTTDTRSPTPNLFAETGEAQFAQSVLPD
jgi:transposase InsO family protein